MNQTIEISFEFFPPKTPKGMQQLLSAAKALQSTGPKYFSVTYGAQGSTQERTLNTVNQLMDYQYAVAPHLTCIGSEKKTIRQLIQHYQQLGIKRLVCLRGDLPENAADNLKDFTHASDLIAFIREVSGEHFHIEVAAYPELHPESSSIEQELEHFKTKVNSGANAAITQYFYDANAYYQLLEDCAKHGIHIPITPGIMPIVNYQQLTKFSAMCGAHIPQWMHARLSSYTENNDLASLKAFATDVLARLCERLIHYGAPGLHFYTLNKAQSSLDILQQLTLLESTDANIPQTV
jgi:methylenetetrahydrofolate reductase (NADPH)